jgi:Arc/MetJ-type ribon-helix-helix transcriptional regulator
MTITLTAAQQSLLLRQLKAGKYKSANEVIDHALAALEEAESSSVPRLVAKNRAVFGGISLQALVHESADPAPKAKAKAASAGSRFFGGFLVKPQQA